MLTDEVGLQRFRDPEDPEQSAQVSVEAARGLARQGDLDEAAHMLRAAIQVEPACTEAWLGLAWLADSPQEREGLLRHVLMLDPELPKARAELARLDHPESPSASAGSKRGNRGLCRWPTLREISERCATGHTIQLEEGEEVRYQNGPVLEQVDQCCARPGRDG